MEKVPGLTAQLAAFISGLVAGQIPPDAKQVACLGFTDSVATLLAGRREPVVSLLMDLHSQDIGAGRSQLCFSEKRAPSPLAALINGTAAHALDYDDVAISGHPSAVLVPTVLAEGQTLGRSGLDMITAYIAGYEVWAELVSRDQEQHHTKGWHPTAIFGTIAAAAAASSLSRLDATRTRHALGIAASHASGVVSNFGSMTKPLQVGRAAQSGILSVRLAAHGITSSADALEHPVGLLRAISPSGRVDTSPAGNLGDRWRILESRLCIKMYPTCYATHRSIDALLELRPDILASGSEIVSIEAEIGEAQGAMLRHHAPTNDLDARFSEEFVLAAAMIAGKVQLEELRDEFINSPDVQSLMKKVSVKTVASRDPKDPVFAPADTVCVRLESGQSFEKTISHARGHADRPVSEEDLWAKFSACTRHSYSPYMARMLFDRLQAMPTLESVDQIPLADEKWFASAAFPLL